LVDGSVKIVYIYIKNVHLREGEFTLIFVLTAAEGTTIREGAYISFPPIRARLFRLNIVKSSDTPTLAEFELSLK